MDINTRRGAGGEGGGGDILGITKSQEQTNVLDPQAAEVTQGSKLQFCSCLRYNTENSNQHSFVPNT